MIKGWIKASDRLPVGTVTAKDPVSKLIGELNVYDDRVTFSAYPSYHIEYKFSDNGLYRLEWLDESPADGDWKLQLMAAIREELSETNRALGIADGFTDDDYKYLGVVSAAFDRLPPKQSLTAPEGV